MGSKFWSRRVGAFARSDNRCEGRGDQHVDDVRCTRFATTSEGSCACVLCARGRGSRGKNEPQRNRSMAVVPGRKTYVDYSVRPNATRANLRFRRPSDHSIGGTCQTTNGITRTLRSAGALIPDKRNRLFAKIDRHPRLDPDFSGFSRFSTSAQLPLHFPDLQPATRHTPVRGTFGRDSRRTRRVKTVPSVTHAQGASSARWDRA